MLLMLMIYLKYIELHLKLYKLKKLYKKLLIELFKYLRQLKFKEEYKLLFKLKDIKLYKILLMFQSKCQDCKL